MILIVSVSDDLHAHAIRHAARELGYDDIHVIECDQISGRESVSWDFPERASVVTSEGKRLAIDSIDLIWWRRANANQSAAVNAASDHQEALVNNDCRGALSGVLAASFQGEWISHPQATTRAGDKIFQLNVAASTGLRVPKTLVTQSKDEVLSFMDRVGRIIVKPVVGAPGPLMFTQFGDDLHQLPSEPFRTAPAVYQEYIEGDRHLRLNCFGDDTYAALIRTSALDWRPDLNVPISPWKVPDDLQAKILDTVRLLGLRIGVVDLKLTPEGEPVWLEVNPQGQFLFLEPILKFPLATAFADYLITSARRARSRRRIAEAPNDRADALARGRHFAEGRVIESTALDVPAAMKHATTAHLY